MKIRGFGFYNVLLALAFALATAIFSENLVLAADLSKEISTDFKATGYDSFLVGAAGKTPVPADVVRKAAFLKAAETTLASGATSFRVTDAQRGGLSLRAPLSDENFAVRLTVETNRSGQQLSDKEIWYSAQKVVEGLRPELLLQLQAK